LTRGSKRFAGIARPAALLLASMAGGLATSSAAYAAQAPLPASAASAAIAAAVSGHPYRLGVVPVRPGADHLGSYAAPAANSANNIYYNGGNAGIGVTTGKEKVYLVFWGSQWGTASTNAKGYKTLSGDPSGMAPYLQAFITGLGTGGETWSGVMTQYCEGVATGAQSCPLDSPQRVGYPAGGAFAGVWADESAAAPAQATNSQIAQEAVNAAGHFGSVDSAANRSAQYVIISPTGTNPDGFTTADWCAWHGYTGNAGSPDGVVAYTNLPYLTDRGATCGQNAINPGSAGTLDGVSIIEGHEYAETITDPTGNGWRQSNTETENGDKCAWIGSGQGATQDISLSTGSFAVQSTWANDFGGGTGGCETTHPILAPAAVPNGTLNADHPGFQPFGASQAYVLGSNGNLWLESAPFGKNPPTRVQVDSNVSGFQALSPSQAYVLGGDGKLWLESGPYGHVPPARVQVDAGVIGFQALTPSQVLVLGSDGKLWLESGPYGTVPPARVAVDAGVAAFQALSSSTILVLGADGKSWLEFAPFGTVPPAREEIDAGVIGFQAISSSQAYVLGSDGKLWLESAPFGIVPRSRLQVDGSVTGFVALGSSQAYVLGSDGKLWLESAPFGTVPPARVLVDGNVLR
jgi:hypothetical protein